jgi:hypothetical protein
VQTVLDSLTVWPSPTKRFLREQMLGRADQTMCAVLVGESKAAGATELSRRTLKLGKAPANVVLLDRIPREIERLRVGHRSLGISPESP